MRLVDIEPLFDKYDKMNEGTEFSPIHFMNDLAALPVVESCEDCIRREDVVRILDWSKASVQMLDDYSADELVGEIITIEKEVENLLSVKPQTVTDFADKCKECGKILNETYQQKWIPVSERLPEDGTWNIWRSKNGALSIERYKKDAFDHFFPSGRFFQLEETIAWMPLPEPYKEAAMESEKCERCIYTYGTLGCCNQVHNEWVYDCDFGQEQFEKRRFLNEYLRKWLSSFNTNSATVCFTEIQELKKKVEKKMNDFKFIIMCGGTYDKWNGEIKHLVKVKGEPLVARTIRLLRECGIEDISISTNHPGFENMGVPILTHTNEYRLGVDQDYGNWLDAFYPITEPTCFMFGDVVFSKEAVQKIVETDVDDIMFFASAPPFADTYTKPWAEPFAYKVVDIPLFFESIEKAKIHEKEGRFYRKPVSWELWQEIKGTPLGEIDYTNYVAINDYTCDIDEPEDIEKIERFIK